jgi:hypothetical protein
MNPYDWEFFESEVTADAYVVADHGTLFGPVTGFTLRRDEDLNLMLDTLSASDSTSSAIERPAGSVYISTAEVKFEGRFGAGVTASGVIPRIVLNTASKNPAEAKKQISSLHTVRWNRQSAGEPRYVIEWVENMSGPFVWPHSDDITETGEKRRRLHGPRGEVILSTPIHGMSSSRSCVQLVIEGIKLFVGVSRAELQHIAKPGFILYQGTPELQTRSKIRDCLSFCLGDFLIYLGDTTFDAEWEPIAFHAQSGHALVKEAPRLTTMPPAPLGLRWEFEITPELLGKMASALYRIYDVYGLQSTLWSYWHALAAPVHMTAAHFGAAIEALQKAYFKASRSEAGRRIVADEQVWKDLYGKIGACIAEADLSHEAKKILMNKAQNLNFAPQSVMMERFFSALGLDMGALEREVWRNRNRAAHGGGADSDNGLRLIRENKVLLIMMNRILLALGSGATHYYDYYNLGRPTMQLARPIRDDRPNVPSD